MAYEPPKLTVKSKIWIENEKGGVILGQGRLLILKAVEEHGSILAASKALGMSYRAVWGKIRASEERLGQPLLTPGSPGNRYGGSELTPLAKALIKRFRRLDELMRTTSDTLFQGVFMDALISREDGGKDEHRNHDDR